MSALLGEEALRRIAEEALRHSRADQTEVSISNTHNSLTRFAANAIHQNVSERDTVLTVRAVVGKRVGAAATNRLDAEGIRKVVEDAQTIARLAREDPQFVSLPGPGMAPAATPIGEGTLRSTPERRAALAGVVCDAARVAGLQASGSVSAGTTEVAAVNSRGLWAYAPMTTGRVVALVHGAGGSGYAEAHNLEVEAIDVGALAERAVRKAQAGRDPISLKPGDYPVVLEPCAVANILQFICLLGFGARGIREGTSFVAGKLGQTVLGTNITIRDDGTDPSGLPRPFDAEGVARKPLTLVRDGVAEEVAYDSYYAHLEGKQSTGHALNSFFNAGPAPVNTFLRSGTAGLEELIAGVERGLLVTRFHYTRTVHPLTVTITGMTRDGTFLIEHGQVTHPVKNLRFTQSYVEALKNAEAIGRETELVGEFAVSRVPALRIGQFAFTGSAE